jgi:hypothetical protein
MSGGRKPSVKSIPIDSCAWVTFNTNILIALLELAMIVAGDPPVSDGSEISTLDASGYLTLVPETIIRYIPWIFCPCKGFILGITSL